MDIDWVGGARSSQLERGACRRSGARPRQERNTDPRRPAVRRQDHGRRPLGPAAGARRRRDLRRALRLQLHAVVGDPAVARAEPELRHEPRRRRRRPRSHHLRRRRGLALRLERALGALRGLRRGLRVCESRPSAHGPGRRADGVDRRRRRLHGECRHRREVLRRQARADRPRGALPLSRQGARAVRRFGRHPRDEHRRGLAVLTPMPGERANGQVEAVAAATAGAGPPSAPPRSRVVSLERERSAHPERGPSGPRPGRARGVRLELRSRPPEQPMQDQRATRLAETRAEDDVDQLAWLSLLGTSGIDESVRRRENLLAASAAASRLLLQAPDVLRVIGEAAGVDRVDLMLAQTGPAGESRLVVASEWAADGVFPRLGHSEMGYCDERNFSGACSELRAGRSVCLSNDQASADESHPCGGLHGIGTKTNAVVPIFVDSEFAGVVTFDACRERRAIGSAELSALETAAGVIGAALHRERLVDAVRRERERAANERAADATSKYAALLRGLEQLTGEVALDEFLSGQVLVAMTRQLGAATGTVIVRDVDRREWRVIAHVRDGRVEPPPYPASLPLTVALPFGPDAGEIRPEQKWRPIHFDLARDDRIEWPGMAEHHGSEGDASLLVLPLLFGQRTVGIMTLSFRPDVPVRLPGTEALVALAQGATVAIELARLADSARDAAVLAERNRIGQEIHDGLAQVFTGILMQLGAAEELDAAANDAFRSQLLARIRDLAREGFAEARRSVMALRPDQTRRNGLELALRQLAARSTVPGRVTSTFEGGGLTTGLPPEHEHELLRIAQEAVSNAVRHGKPQTVHLAMTDEETHWVLSVADDGCGLRQAPELSAQEGFGLASMRERANAIGGEWRIDSEFGAGTRVSVRLAMRSGA